MGNTESRKKEPEFVLRYPKTLTVSFLRKYLIFTFTNMKNSNLPLGVLIMEDPGHHSIGDSVNSGWYKSTQPVSFHKDYKIYYTYVGSFSCDNFGMYENLFSDYTILINNAYNNYKCGAPIGSEIRGVASIGSEIRGGTPIGSEMVLKQKIIEYISLMTGESAPLIEKKINSRHDDFLPHNLF